MASCLVWHWDGIVDIHGVKYNLSMKKFVRAISNRLVTLLAGPHQEIVINNADNKTRSDILCYLETQGLTSQEYFDGNSTRVIIIDIATIKNKPEMNDLIVYLENEKLKIARRTEATDSKNYNQIDQLMTVDDEWSLDNGERTPYTVQSESSIESPVTVATMMSPLMDPMVDPLTKAEKRIQRRVKTKSNSSQEPLKSPNTFKSLMLSTRVSEVDRETQTFKKEFKSKPRAKKKSSVSSKISQMTSTQHSIKPNEEKIVRLVYPIFKDTSVDVISHFRSKKKEEFQQALQPKIKSEENILKIEPAKANQVKQEINEDKKTKEDPPVEMKDAQMNTRDDICSDISSGTCKCSFLPRSLSTCKHQKYIVKNTNHPSKSKFRKWIKNIFVSKKKRKESKNKTKSKKNEKDKCSQQLKKLEPGENDKFRFDKNKPGTPNLTNRKQKTGYFDDSSIINKSYVQMMERDLKQKVPFTPVQKSMDSDPFTFTRLLK